MDATNVFDKTDVCVLTSIGLDHCHILGDTREKIAVEKSGIIKNESDVIFIDYEDSVSDVFYEKAKSCSAVVNSISKNQYSVEKIKHKSIDFLINLAIIIILVLLCQHMRFIRLITHPWHCVHLRCFYYAII